MLVFFFLPKIKKQTPPRLRQSIFKSHNILLGRNCHSSVCSVFIDTLGIQRFGGSKLTSLIRIVVVHIITHTHTHTCRKSSYTINLHHCKYTIKLTHIIYIYILSFCRVLRTPFVRHEYGFCI